jgi:hypothetical protein
MIGSIPWILRHSEFSQNTTAQSNPPRRVTVAAIFAGSCPQYGHTGSFTIDDEGCGISDASVSVTLPILHQSQLALFAETGVVDP